MSTGQLEAPAPSPAPAGGITGRCRVVHEDEACVVVLKPAGLLSVPGRGALAVGSLAERVQQGWPEARVVHRLDMATSGLLLFAQGAHWQRVFGRLFAERAINKHYVAVVRGRIDGEQGEIGLSLAADWPNRPRQRVDLQQGKPALTRWQVLARDPAGRWTRLALQPVTGRTHQLRVHLAAVGHPILGDALYCPETAASEAPRLLLHAQGLSWVHPLHGGRLQLEAPAPF